MKDKLLFLGDRIRELKNYYFLFEYIIIKSTGWVFLILGIYNFLKYNKFFFDDNTKRYISKDIDRMNFLFYFSLTFVIIPILMGVLLLSKKNSLKSNKNE
jgi:hypothetical protein